LDWIVVSLLSTALFALVTILDKRLVASEFPTASSFNLGFGFLQFYIAAVGFTVVSQTVGFDGGAGIPWSIVSGFLWALGLFTFFHGLRYEDASRATTIQMTAPVYTSAVAVVFLGEILSLSQWLMIILVVAGAALISVKPHAGGLRFASAKALTILFVAAFIISMAFIATDQATDRASAWAVQPWRAISMATTLMVLTLRPGAWADLKTVLARPKPSLMLFATEGVMAPIAALLFIWAVALGPVSLVSTVTSTRPLMVLILTTVLSTKMWNVLGEPLDRQTLGLKITSTLMIVAGVIGLGWS